MITTGLMSSATDQWATPQGLFDELNAEFGFTLDACASEWNHKVDNYFDEAMDSLKQGWTGTVWMNPPYGRTIKQWMAKAYEASQGGGNCCLPCSCANRHSMVVGLQHEG